MFIANSGCDTNKLTYKAFKHEEKIFNAGIMAISNNLGRVFYTTHQCAICGRVGNTFEDCEELQALTAIRKSYIKFCVTLQKIKDMGSSQGHDVNSLRLYKLSYVNSIHMLPPIRCSFRQLSRKAGRPFS